ncbi:MAG: hypothetical protein MJ078_00185 [Clostridia bacterium]|nr:hypothetical protein [Clostridia bacterium]
MLLIMLTVCMTVSLLSWNALAKSEAETVNDSIEMTFSPDTGTYPICFKAIGDENYCVFPSILSPCRWEPRFCFRMAWNTKTQLMNGTRLFRQGSRFYARVVSPNAEEWMVLWNNIDASARTRLKRDTQFFPEVGVTDTDGAEYRDLGDLTELFIQASSARRLL